MNLRRGRLGRVSRGDTALHGPSRRSRRPLLFTWAAIGWVACSLSCAQETQSKPTRDIVGVAVDADTQEPISGALIFEVIPAGTSGADVRRVVKARSTTTDRDGRFRFEPTRAPLSIRRTYPPRYHFYHSSYGLIRGGEASTAPVRFVPSLRDAHLRQADASALCVASKAPDVDEMNMQIAKQACPPARPEAFASGKPRAEGPRDANGRRDGRWRFFRENGSVIAVGDYQSGAALGDWKFSPPNETSAN